MAHAYVVDGVRLALGEDPEALPKLLAERLGCQSDDLHQIVILKRSLDARRRQRPHYDHRIKVELDRPLRQLPGHVSVWEPTVFPPFPKPSDKLRGESIVIIGAGPAGLFAALALAKRGVRATILERGKEVSSRAKDVSQLVGKGRLDPDSNICFGEGGAGTFSDGKLYTRIGGPEPERVFQWMVELGAPADILVDRRPHLGTDRLVRLIQGIRKRLEEEGTTFRFSSYVETIREANGRSQIVLRGEQAIDADRVVLAIGHSARRLYAALRKEGFAMEAKPFAVGFRVEHPQALINEIQFGHYAQELDVPPAEYRLTFDQTRQGTAQHIHTFCMCPGGSIVPTTTKEGEVCVNGMSHAARSGHYANSAIVTPLNPEELADGLDPLLAGIRFQERVERQAFGFGGGQFRAPASDLLDYVDGRPSRELRKTTYRRGVTATDLSGCYPEAITERLRLGIRQFEKKMRGFLTQEAVLIGVETRTSAPVRILRDHTFRSLTHPSVYPAGEGAGYAGGITSAAVDGLLIARQILAGN